MAKLTSDQWAEIRAEWEASPKQGIEWLSKEHGGPWDITAEALRRKRIRDGLVGQPWTKPVNMGDVVRRARLAADAATADLVEPRRSSIPGINAEETVEAALQVGSQEQKTEVGETADGMAVDVRARLIETHRREWRVARGLAVKAIQEAAAAKGFDVAKFAKILTEILTNIQAGERKAWGLDADLLDLDNMTDAQLLAVATGKASR
jgi:hypothetical protein